MKEPLSDLLDRKRFTRHGITDAYLLGILCRRIRNCDAHNAIEVQVHVRFELLYSGAYGPAISRYRLHRR
jgi:hypothetical protein